MGQFNDYNNYIICRDGTCYSIHKDIFIEAILNREFGFNEFHLFKDSITEIVPVHVVIATAFLPNPLKKTLIKHKDGNKFNNNCENLEWAEDYYKSMNTDRDYKESITIKSTKKGVYYLPKQNKWLAKLMKNTISYSKVFSNEEDAILYRVGLENAHFLGRKGKEKSTKLHIRNTSGHKGVSWSKRDKIWLVQYQKNNKSFYRSFHDKDEAIKYRKELEILYK
jgi:hypothetical protein